MRLIPIFFSPLKERPLSRGLGPEIRVVSTLSAEIRCKSIAYFPNVQIKMINFCKLHTRPCNLSECIACFWLFVNQNWQNVNCLFMKKMHFFLINSVFFQKKRRARLCI